MGGTPSTLRVDVKLRQKFRTWDIRNVYVARAKYKAMTMRFCIDSLQLAHILGLQAHNPLIVIIQQIFTPAKAKPTSIMIDVAEVLIGLALLCQANMKQRVECKHGFNVTMLKYADYSVFPFVVLFDLFDLQGNGTINDTDLYLCKVAIYIRSTIHGM